MNLHEVTWKKIDDFPQEKSALETPIITLAVVQNLTIYLINNCVKEKMFYSIPDSNMWLWRGRILEYSRRTRYVTYTWNIRVEYGRIHSVYYRSWMFVKVYHTSVVLLEYDAPGGMMANPLMGCELL